MRRTLAITAVGIGLAIGGVPMMAHHAFSSEFDANKHVEMTGTVTKMEWVNPHSWIHIDVKNPQTGQIENWAIEGGTPNTLLRRGLRKTDLPVGAAIKVDGYQAKDGGLRANGKNLTFADGRQLFLGSSGTGAPDETGK
jgi:hypothetical protein